MKEWGIKTVEYLPGMHEENINKLPIFPGETIVFTSKTPGWAISMLPDDVKDDNYTTNHFCITKWNYEDIDALKCDCEAPSDMRVFFSLMHF